MLHASWKEVQERAFHLGMCAKLAGWLAESWCGFVMKGIINKRWFTPPTVPPDMVQSSYHLITLSVLWVTLAFVAAEVWQKGDPDIKNIRATQRMGPCFIPFSQLVCVLLCFTLQPFTVLNHDCSAIAEKQNHNHSCGSEGHYIPIKILAVLILTGRGCLSAFVTLLSFCEHSSIAGAPPDCYYWGGSQSHTEKIKVCSCC